MSNAYFTSLSGMMAASFGLKSVSHNVSNMQTPGYKGSSAFYAAIGGNHSHYQSLGGYGFCGNGVSIGGNTTNFEQGKLVQGSSKSQLAINGEGMFIIQLENNNLLYTRDGEFHFNQDDFLVDDHSGGFVMGYGNNGQLVKISKKGPPSYPGKASAEINLSGEIWSREHKKSDDTSGDIPGGLPGEEQLFEDVEIRNIEIYDEKGQMHSLTLTFKIDGDTFGQGKEANQLILKKVSENGNILFDNSFMSSELYGVHYDAAGYPKDYKHAISFSLQFKGCAKQSLKLELRHNTNQVVKLFSPDTPGLEGETEVKVAKQDGYATGYLYDYEFDQEGQLHYLYSNGKKNEGLHVALARFDDPQKNLISTGENTFSARTQRGIHIATAQSALFGNLSPQTLESSNIDSTQEFANIVILQRMFQACSQIMDIEKQLLDEMAKK